jgi:hypothetical protein
VEHPTIRRLIPLGRHQLLCVSDNFGGAETTVLPQRFAFGGAKAKSMWVKNNKRPAKEGKYAGEARIFRGKVAVELPHECGDD